ncbi:DNA primase [Marininema halotolerans]|uniref:DNA primase n=1 Tax=Marininema halotolerans TaxID=1155944 RepID=A0A1I6SY36_9BACL|nr:DNA primase [Marininema halotolerans]SFS81856.1 DNA primase [Marininema halotolerans]
MSGRIPEEVIDRVREHHDIVDVVGRTVQLKKSGRNFFGLCPFHSEKSPSFSVSPEKQIFHCFGCGLGGNVFRFIMESEQMTFIEALRHLAEEAGIEVPTPDSREDSAEERHRLHLLQAMDLAGRLYHHLLTETDHGKEAREYLRERGILPETMAQFQIGYAPDSYHFLHPFMKRRGFSEEVLAEVGLISERERRGKPSYFDRFRGRIMFPIQDSQGRVIAFGARILGDGRPKYLNSPETTLFHKSHFLYNLHRARKGIRTKEQAVLFEGYMDVIAAWQAGLTTGVATLGTALTDSQARVIRRNTEEVVICYDSDSAGFSATVRGMDVLKQAECIVKVAQLPDGMDPDDYIRVRGADAFQSEVIAQAVPFTAFKLESLKKEFNLRDTDDRMSYLNQAVNIVAELPHAIERDHYLRRLSEEFRVSLDALKQEQRVVASKKRRESMGDKGQGKWHNGYQESKHMVGQDRKALAFETAERRLLLLMIHHADIAEQVREKVGAEFNVEAHAAIAAYLYAYYAEGYTADPARFIHYVKDDRLVQEISALMMSESHDDQVSNGEIADYIRHIRNYPLHRKIEQKQEQVKQAERSGNIAEAVQLGIELMKLREKVQRETE